MFKSIICVLMIASLGYSKLVIDDYEKAKTGRNYAIVGSTILLAGVGCLAGYTAMQINNKGKRNENQLIFYFASMHLNFGGMITAWKGRNYIKESTHKIRMKD